MQLPAAIVRVGAILELRERILRKPVTPLEFETGAAAVRDEAARAKREAGLPDGFEQAVQTVTEAVFAGKPVRTPAQKAEAAEAALRRIGPEDIGRRLRQWLEADDKLVQVQSPDSDGVKDFPRPSEIAALAENCGPPNCPNCQPIRRTAVLPCGRKAAPSLQNSMNAV